jgi:hypothetical protein
LAATGAELRSVKLCEVSPLRSTQGNHVHSIREHMRLPHIWYFWRRGQRLCKFGYHTSKGWIEHGAETSPVFRRRGRGEEHHGRGKAQAAHGATFAEPAAAPAVANGRQRSVIGRPDFGQPRLPADRRFPRRSSGLAPDFPEDTANAVRPLRRTLQKTGSASRAQNSGRGSTGHPADAAEGCRN